MWKSIVFRVVKYSFAESDEEQLSYVDYIMETTQKLLAIPSHTGFTHKAAEFVMEELRKMGFET